MELAVTLDLCTAISCIASRPLCTRPFTCALSSRFGAIESTIASNLHLCIHRHTRAIVIPTFESLSFLINRACSS
jgi:hypothetical protein